MLEILVFFHMESCSVDWQVHVHPAVRCEVKRQDSKCKVEVQCRTGKSQFDARANTLVHFTEVVELSCGGLSPGEQRNQQMRVDAEVWSVVSCRAKE